ncbi:hypothetical protein M436DRAFT_85058 [Aureobasidium namibiae CBS 147.97]|uniref:BTB domain-containing protein n=1 Tax=Aureobasidium namibiae CBS 147.97 TaxID=1043004 RepID=A0A074X605_9PEZI
MWPPDYAIRISYDRPTTDLRRYFDVEAHSDLVLQCGEDRIHVQKKILQTWSEHFKELLQSSPQVGEGPLILEGDDPATMRALIKYMYGVPYIAHSPYQQHNEPTFVGEFFNPEDEDAKKLNDL